MDYSNSFPLIRWIIHTWAAPESSGRHIIQLWFTYGCETCRCLCIHSLKATLPETRASQNYILNISNEVRPKMKTADSKCYIVVRKRGKVVLFWLHQMLRCKLGNDNPRSCSHQHRASKKSLEGRTSVCFSSANEANDCAVGEIRSVGGSGGLGCGRLQRNHVKSLMWRNVSEPNQCAAQRGRKRQNTGVCSEQQRESINTQVCPSKLVGVILVCGSSCVTCLDAELKPHYHLWASVWFHVHGCWMLRLSSNA